MKKISTFLFLMTLFSVTSIAQFTVIEDFEETSPFPWGAWVGSGSVDASDSYSGLQMFDTGGAWAYRDDVVYGVTGDTVSCWTKIGTGRTYWGFGASAGGCWSFVAAPNTGDIRFQQNPSYGYVELSSTPFSFTTGSWYKMEVIFLGPESVIGNLYDSDGTTLLVSVSETLTGFTPGGFAFRTFGGMYVDYLGATDVCLPLYSTVDITSCGDYTVPSGDETYSVGGTAMDTLIAVSTGCDSILTINFTVNEVDTAAITYPSVDYCADDTLNPVPTIDSTMGGTFSAEAGLMIDPVSGEVDVDGSTSGVYTIEYLTPGICPDSAFVTFNVNPLPVVSAVTTTLETAGADGSIDITVTSGTPTFSFDWDNDGTGDFDDDEDLTGLTPGVYTVVIVDSKGCETIDSATVDSQLGLDDYGNFELLVYPNPAEDFVSIVVPEGSFSYQLISLEGKVVRTGEAIESEVLDLNELPSGVYQLSILKDGLAKNVKIVRQ